MKKILQNSVFQQLIFWVISFIILYRLFTRESDIGITDVLFTILFHLPLIVAFYGNYYLVKKYLINNKAVTFYLLGIFLLLFFGIGLHYFTFDFLSDWIFSGYYFVSYYTISEVLQFIGSYLLVSTLLFLSKNWFLLKEKQLVLEKENHIVKLASLKAQLNPHFLFNSLNNIYGITSSENKLGKNYLLKLSDALRYMIYDTAEDLVPLEKEITYLKNYIDLETLRMENDKNIYLEVQGDFSGYMVAPLILLPLVENCFKHCDRDNPLIDLKLSINKAVLFLKINNNRSHEQEAKISGIGLQNLKSRLNLIYPNKHQFEIEKSEYTYQSSLQINLEQ